MATSRLRLVSGQAYLYTGSEGIYQVITGQAQTLTGDSKVSASGSLQVTGSIFLQDQGEAPAPGGSEAALYARGGTLYFKNSGGSETAVGAGLSDDAVTNFKLANMPGGTIKGRSVGVGTGDPTDLTATQATAILNEFTSALKGLAPASGGGTTNFLRADGTWAAPAGSEGAGDVTGPASSTDNAIVRFDGAGGKTIQSSAVTIADISGDITTPGDIAVNGGDITTTASVFNIGTTATTGNRTLNLGTAAQTLNTKVVNLGTGGVGGVTNVNIGSSDGAIGTVKVNQDFKYSKALAASPIQVLDVMSANLEDSARYVRMEGAGILTLPGISALNDGRIVTIANARVAGASNYARVNVAVADAVYTTGGQVSWGDAGPDSFKLSPGEWVELEAAYVVDGTSIWYVVCGGTIPTLTA